MTRKFPAVVHTLCTIHRNLCTKCCPCMENWIVKNRVLQSHDGEKTVAEEIAIQSDKLNVCDSWVKFVENRKKMKSERWVSIWKAVESSLCIAKRKWVDSFTSFSSLVPTRMKWTDLEPSLFNPHSQSAFIYPAIVVFAVNLQFTQCKNRSCFACVYVCVRFPFVWVECKFSPTTIRSESIAKHLQSLEYSNARNSAFRTHFTAFDFFFFLLFSIHYICSRYDAIWCRAVKRIRTITIAHTKSVYNTV